MLTHQKNPLSRARDNSTAGMFENVLRAFEDGDLTFFDFQSTLKRLLADGASPDEFLKILRRRELIEPMPKYAHEEILGLLEAEIRVNAVRSAKAAAVANPGLSSTEQRAAPGRTPSADSDADESAMSRLIHALAADWDPESAASAGAASSALEADNKAMRVALDEREEDLVALRAEHARVLGLLETRARSTAQLETDLRELSAELESTRSALVLQQNKTREVDEALAKRIAAEEAARERHEEAEVRTEQALRSAEIYQMELKALQESVATRDAALEQARHSLDEHAAALEQARHALNERDAALEQVHHSLDEHAAALEQARYALNERDAQVASLQQDYSQMAPMLETRAQSAAKLQADLQAAHARSASLEADLSAARAALGAEQSKSRHFDNASAEQSALNTKAVALQRSLDERTLELAAYKQEQSKLSAALAARAKTLESELKSARQRVDALTLEVKRSRESAAAPVVTRVVMESPRPAAPPKAKPSVERADYAPLPLPAAQRWTRDTRVRALGACAAAAALIIGVWMFAHHAPAPAL
jgi:myosin heavy subunit